MLDPNFALSNIPVLMNIILFITTIIKTILKYCVYAQFLYFT